MADGGLVFAGGGTRIRVAPAAAEEMRRLAAVAFPQEVAGVLVGRYVGGDLAEIVSVTGPTTDSTHGLTACERGSAGLTELLERLWDEGLYYLGEWHTHPAAPPTPSDTDTETMRGFARDPAVRCPEPILLILGGVAGAEIWSASMFGTVERWLERTS